MANLVLRPNADGNYTDWDPSAGTDLYALINEPDKDDDTTYISTSNSNAFTVLCSTAVAGSWPRASRIRSIRVSARVRTTGTSAYYKWRLRLLGTDYDGTVEATTSNTYVEIYKEFDMIPNGYFWELASLSHAELGLVYVDGGDELRCTKLEVFVHYEPVPFYTLAPDGAGALQDWQQYPASSPAYMTVNGVYDGDLSYLKDSTVNNISTFTVSDLPSIDPFYSIHKVNSSVLVRNTGSTTQQADVIMRSGAVNYHGGTNTTAVPLAPDEDYYHLLREDYLNDPSSAWPSGNPAAAAWAEADVNALEIGVENAQGGNFRCTSIAAEVWLAPTALASYNFYPVSDGHHQDWSSIVGAAAAWDAIDENPPDDVTSYILLDADAAGDTRYSSFGVDGGGAILAGQRIYNVEVRCRVRLGNLPHSSAVVVPVMRLPSTPETYTGKPQLIEGTGGNWFDLVWDFNTNPDSAVDAPWTNLNEVRGVEFGLAVLSGSVLLSRLRVQPQTSHDYRGTPDPVDFQMTDAAVDPVTGWITKANATGVIYVVREFAVGTGGYSATDPSTVTAVNPAAVALINQVYRGTVGHIEYDVTGTPWTVDYWCRVPQEAVEGGIGEIALIGEVLWSPNPADIGTEFLFAVMHHPIQTRHDDSASFYKLRIEYP